jgi:hypothetical protein
MTQSGHRAAALSSRESGASPLGSAIQRQRDTRVAMNIKQARRDSGERIGATVVRRIGAISAMAKWSLRNFHTQPALLRSYKRYYRCETTCRRRLRHDLNGALVRTRGPRD